MSVIALDHIQLAMPAGREAEARAFYAGLFGLAEVEKPAALAQRGGCWFERGLVKVHLGVEPEFRPARKAHPAVTVADLDALARLLSEAGHKPAWDDAIPGVRRFYVEDPVGNRIEFMDG